MKAAGIFLLLLVWHTSFSQWTESFEDGELMSDPSWAGDTVDYLVENNILRLMAPAVTGKSSISAISDNINDAEWHVLVRFDFNPSSSNYTKVYLVSDGEDLGASLKGYFIKLGGTEDEVSLFRQDGSSESKIIDGIDGRLSLSEVKVEVKATRTLNGEWQLYSKLNSDPVWVFEGSTADNNHQSSSFFGLLCVYTSTRSTKFYFDDITVSGSAYLDIDAPVVDTAFVVDATHINIQYDEMLEASSATNQNNYLLNNTILPINIGFTSSSVLLEYVAPLPVISTLTISGVMDNAQNTANDTTVQVIYIDPLVSSFGDVVINEIMADPTPREDLPELEYLELYNASGRAINMTNWSYSDKISTYNFDEVIILPDSFLILSPKNSATLLQLYGRVVGLSPWPSLNNSGDSLSLKNEIGDVVDLLTYDKTWYGSVDKDNGGWSLERINPYHPCSGFLNWRASEDARGGSPGMENSVISLLDIDPPQIIAYNLFADQIDIYFDKPLADTLGGISMTPINTIKSYYINYNHLKLLFERQFVAEQLNELEMEFVSDCFGNLTENIGINFTPDFIPPVIDTVFANYPNIIEVYFNEAVILPEIASFYINLIGAPNNIEIEEKNMSHIRLVFDELFIENSEYNLSAYNIKDVYNNMTIQSQYDFTYQPLDYALFGELLITEIMADPSPPVNLPEVEYIEISNVSNKRLLLKGMLLADTRTTTSIPTGILEPEQRVILTKNTFTEAFSKNAYTIGVTNWPSLNNLGDGISISDNTGRLIHHVSYTVDWYDNDEKAEGGWALELIDEENYCAGDVVWSASDNHSGGTPGTVNSIVTTFSDLTIPRIDEAFIFSNDSIWLSFSEPLNEQLPGFTITPGSIRDLKFKSPAHKEVLLHVDPLVARIRYTLSVGPSTDCVGNINDLEEIELFLPEKALAGEVVISEVLFNPLNDGVDFIEIYNRTAKHISLFNWQLKNETLPVPVGNRILMAPYSFTVLTEDPATLIENYPKAKANNIYFSEIPTLANLEGKVGLRNEEDILMDSIHYQEEWHFPYLADVNGVSLERVDYNLLGTQSSNWSSAASGDNYATPGYGKPQSRNTKSTKILSIEPRVIVPNANGRDDFALITLKAPGSGALVTITAYNLQGQRIKQIANNELINGGSTFKWDGTDKSGAIVPLGHYIIVAETISDSGSTETFREKVVVATGY